MGQYLFTFFSTMVNLYLYISFLVVCGERCNSMVECPLMLLCVTGSIPHSGPIEIFLVPTSAPRLVQQRPWYVLSCLLGDAYIRSLAS